MSYSKFKFFFSSDEEGTFWPGVVELPVDNEVSSVEPTNDENKNCLQTIESITIF